MYKVLTLNNISVAGLERLPRDSYEISSEIQHPDAILVRSAKMHGMELPETVKAIGRAGAGVNNIPVDKMTELGIRQELAIKKDRRADAGAQRQQDDDPLAILAGAEPDLSDSCGVCIVDHRDRPADVLGEELAGIGANPGTVHVGRGISDAVLDDRRKGDSGRTAVIEVRGDLLGGPGRG